MPHILPDGMSEAMSEQRKSANVCREDLRETKGKEGRQKGVKERERKRTGAIQEEQAG